MNYNKRRCKKTKKHYRKERRVLTKIKKQNKAKKELQTVTHYNILDRCAYKRVKLIS